MGCLKLSILDEQYKTEQNVSSHKELTPFFYVKNERRVLLYAYCKNNPIVRIDPTGLTDYDVETKGKTERKTLNDGRDNIRVNVSKSEYNKLERKYNRQNGSYEKYSNKLMDKNGYTSTSSQNDAQDHTLNTFEVNYHKPKGSDMTGVQISPGFFDAVGGAVDITVGHVKGEGFFASIGLRFGAGADDGVSVGIVKGTYHKKGQPSSSQLAGASGYVDFGALGTYTTLTRDGINNPTWTTTTTGITIGTKTVVGGSAGISITFPPLKF